MSSCFGTCGIWANHDLVSRKVKKATIIATLLNWPSQVHNIVNLQNLKSTPKTYPKKKKEKRKNNPQLPPKPIQIPHNLLRNKKHPHRCQPNLAATYNRVARPILNTPTRDFICHESIGSNCHSTVNRFMLSTLPTQVIVVSNKNHNRTSMKAKPISNHLELDLASPIEPKTLATPYNRIPCCEVTCLMKLTTSTPIVIKVLFSMTSLTSLQEPPRSCTKKASSLQRTSYVTLWFWSWWRFQNFFFT